MPDIVKFNPTSKQSARAVQAWQILVGKAMDRKTVTYEGLSKQMFKKKAQGVLNRILGHIAFYCIKQQLPPLTAIVVGKGRGVPGDAIPADISKLDSERESVYECDWYDIYPPSEQALAEAFVDRSDRSSQKKGASTSLIN